MLGSPTAARLPCAVCWGVVLSPRCYGGCWSPKSPQLLLWSESRGVKSADPMRSFYSKAQGTGAGGCNLSISAEQHERYSMNPGSFLSAAVRVSWDADRYSEHPRGHLTQRRYGWPWTFLDRFPGFLLDSAAVSDRQACWAGSACTLENTRDN